MRWIYFLIIHLKEDKDIEVGSLGKIEFENGYYVYIGSAQNGLEARVNRHLSEDKSKHWHVDYLLEFAAIEKVYIVEAERKDKECDGASYLKKYGSEIDGFGSSDCDCSSHLFFISKRLDEAEDIVSNFNDSKRLDLTSMDS